MKLLRLILLALLFSSCAGISDRRPSSSNNYSRNTVVVFSGGGFQYAIFLGMLDELERQNLQPDYIVASCGGAIAGAIAKTFPTSSERKAFIESDAFYQSMRQIKFFQNGIPSALKTALSANLKVQLGDSRLPNIFNSYILDVPNDFQIPGAFPEFSDPGPRLVIIAGKANFGSSYVGKSLRKLNSAFEEHYFTDPETAKLLYGIPSGVDLAGIDNSYISPTTKTITDVPLLRAVRASISDMFYMQPAEINGDFYITGGINLYPIEVARNLGETVIMPYSESLEAFVERPAFQVVTGFDNEKRHRFAMSQWAAHWVDLSDSSSIYDKYGLNPKPNFFSMRIDSQIPNDREEYVKKIRGLWEYGRARMAESLSQPRQSKTHIRKK